MKAAGIIDSGVEPCDGLESAAMRTYTQHESSRDAEHFIFKLSACTFVWNDDQIAPKASSTLWLSSFHKTIFLLVIRGLFNESSSSLFKVTINVKSCYKLNCLLWRIFLIIIKKKKFICWLIVYWELVLNQ